MAAVSLLIACGNYLNARQGPPPAPPRRVVVQPPRLYGTEEALRDALSGPLNHVGTGTWPGSNRTFACAFRNARVIVVNVYCGVRDAQAFRLEVYSPARGRVRIYAESKAPVSQRVRPEYFSFTAESEPPAPDKGVLPVRLQMSFSELRAYEAKRYQAYLPSCYAGTERRKDRSGCLGSLASEATAWQKQNRAFLDHANDEWYRVMRSLRTLATRYGKDPG